MFSQLSAGPSAELELLTAVEEAGLEKLNLAGRTGVLLKRKGAEADDCKKVKGADSAGLKKFNFAGRTGVLLKRKGAEADDCNKVKGAGAAGLEKLKGGKEEGLTILTAAPTSGSFSSTRVLQVDPKSA